MSGPQTSMDFGAGKSLPLIEIQQMILDRGRLSKDDILLLWNLSEEQYASLKDRLDGEKLFEPGPRRVGGFVARFNRKPKSEPESEAPSQTFKAPFEGVAVARLTELLSHQELEDLLGPLLIYTIRRARKQLTGEDRRGSKAELAAALLTKHGIDLFADKEVRAVVARKTKKVSPGRWHPGKGAALKFVEAVNFPMEYAGIPAEEPPADFEYLEGRVDLNPLQDFQLEVQGKLERVLRAKAGRAIVTLPTGGGKTRVAVDTIRDWLSGRYGINQSGAGNLVLWLAHTEELCEQAYACFKEVWQSSSSVCPIALFRFWGGFTRDLEEHRESILTIRQRPAVLVSTPQRLLNVIERQLPGSDAILEALLELAGLVVIDEAHRAAAPTYRKLVSVFSKAAGSPAIVGLTATPFRAEYAPSDPTAGTLELRELFGTIIEPVETLGEEPRQVLQERGILARPVFGAIKTETRLKAPEGVDTDNPSLDDIEKIDYAFKLRADRPDRRLTVLKELERYCAEEGSSIIYFGPTVQDAECMAFMLRQRGIEAAFVSGETRDVTRRKIIGDFKAGLIKVLCNCEVLTTGFDAPRVTHVVLARPTVSQVLYEQMVGRGLRGEKFGGTATCHIVDLEDNYSLTARPQLGYRRFRELWGSGEIP